MKLANLVLPPVPVLAALAVVAMLGLQAWVEYRLLAPLVRETVKVSEELNTLRKLSAREAPERPKTKLRLNEILAHLPDQHGTAMRIERLHQVAAANNVVLRKASYKSQLVTPDIWRHEIQADVGGAYPDMRQFLRDLAEQDQASAVDSLEFSRPPGSTGVRAQLRLTLYFRRMAS
jgi:Tfp pilus assembly protein PilO